MSTTPLLPVWSLGLVDDAAVFPPGLSPLDQAWRDHQELRSGAYAECVGPLLLAPIHVSELVLAAHADHENSDAGRSDSDDGAGLPPVSVRVIGRAGTPFTDLHTAIETLGKMSGVLTAGLEISYGLGWTAALQHGLPLAVEVSRVAAERDSALDEIARVRADDHPVIAKLRTQSTASVPVPTAAELAGFVIDCRQRDLPFKLTGGLHHAVATGWERQHAVNGKPEHGVMNVLLATHAALSGAATAEMAQILTRTDAPALAASLRTLTREQQRDLRAAFTSYGCCGVLDPLAELAALGLLPAPIPDEEPV